MSDRPRRSWAGPAQLALIALMVAASLWAWLQLPAGARIATHFNANGEADGWSGAALGLSLLPVLAALLQLLRHWLPWLDPRGHNLLRSATAYDTIWLAVTAVLAGAHGLIIGHALGLLAPMAGLPAALVGGMLIVIGNVMGKLRWNYSVGIRTPWTLANERVWDQTHRFGGRLMVLTGLLLLALAFVPALQPWLKLGMIGLPLAMGAAVVLKSFLLWREQQRAA